ncbi:hypothetical protein, partial [Streptomyces sp900116325]|uniref:hypothetical protein n=1 Tax=Streptomyces sp. 900116325 TaxID=3154295 RepID=UPI00340754FC
PEQQNQELITVTISNIDARHNFPFDRVRPSGGKQFSNSHVVRTISLYDETSVTHAYISLLRKGERTPTITIVPLFARFFGVEAAYFVEDEVTREVMTQFEMLRKLSETDVQQIALRATGVSEAGRRQVLAALDAVREAESLPANPEKNFP